MATKCCVVHPSDHTEEPRGYNFIGVERLFVTLKVPGAVMVSGPAKLGARDTMTVERVGGLMDTVQSMVSPGPKTCWLQ